GEREGHGDRAERLRAAQPAETAGADVQDLLGVNREERRRAAEQHREEIERDRGEDDLRVAHETEAGEELRDRMTGAARLDPEPLLDREEKEDEEQAREGVGEVDEGVVEMFEQLASDRR